MIYLYPVKNLIFLILLTITSMDLFSQNDAKWWNDIHHWDGITPWTNYMVISPSYFGPNALPVPFSMEGKVKDRIEFKTELTSHFSKGDNTQNMFLDMYIPLVKNKFAIDFWGVPVEHYKMTEPTVIERRGRNRKGSGYAIGDFYFSTILQIIRNKKFPDVAFRMACRTASGSKLSDARYTDAPGYFFDVSFGKDVSFSQMSDHTIRFHGMAGFYSWQMNMPNNRQNDAILFGAGLDLTLNAWEMKTSVDGYSGYIGHHQEILGDVTEPVYFDDRPVVYRLEFIRKFSKIDFSVGYQTGLHDFNYRSLLISFVFHRK